MKNRRIVIVGGGPGGLLAARLLSRADFDVTLYERLDPRATYGFGVALARRVLDRLEPFDAEAVEQISSIAHPLTRWTMRRGDQSASIEDHGSFGVERSALLRTLQNLAVSAGAKLETGVEASAEAALESGDAVIFADGAGSLGRGLLSAELEPSVTEIPLPYIWCGANLDLGGMTLDLRNTPDGIFCGHVMPYGGGLSAFQIDALPEALESAGLGADFTDLPPSASDTESLEYLAEVFSPTLGGGPLAGNRSRWSPFTLVYCGRWSHGKAVLIGDAAHTAHYSLGSGTRMAMEDALVLSEALVGGESLADAYGSFEADRRPAVEHLQWRASRSQLWWRSLPSRFDLPLPVLMLNYFTRTARMQLEELAEMSPDVVDFALEALARDGGSRPDFAPDSVASDGWLESLEGEAARQALAGRVVPMADLGQRALEIDCDPLQPWSADTARLCGNGRDREKAILLTGSDDRRRVLERFDIAEEVRATAGAAVGVAVPGDGLDDAATAVAARRVDWVALDEAPR